MLQNRGINVSVESSFKRPRNVRRQDAGCMNSIQVSHPLQVEKGKLSYAANTKSEHGRPTI